MKKRVAKGVYETSKEIARDRKKPGQSNSGKYKNVKPDDFAGPNYTYPINTRQRAESALRLAHNASNPSAIKRKVYSKWPSLKPTPKGK